jgi:hypothetical protein
MGWNRILAVMPALVAGIRVFFAYIQREGCGDPAAALEKWFTMSGTRCRDGSERHISETPQPSLLIPLAASATP